MKKKGRLEILIEGGKCSTPLQPKIKVNSPPILSPTSNLAQSAWDSAGSLPEPVLLKLPSDGASSEEDET